MYYLRLIKLFIQVSLQEEMAYHVNFFITLLYSLLNLAIGILSVVVIFTQVNSIHGWNFSSTLALLGTYLILGAIRAIVFGPSFDKLVGIDGEVWTGQLDYTLSRPAPMQLLASARHWRFLPIIDLLIGTGVTCAAIFQLKNGMSIGHILAFLCALIIGITILYALLLFFASLVFWSPGLLATRVFDGVFQMARYPLGLYPGWVRFALTWIIPVGIITTLPAEALVGMLSPLTLLLSAVGAGIFVIAVSLFFQMGLRHYASASS